MITEEQLSTMLESADLLAAPESVRMLVAEVRELRATLDLRTKERDEAMFRWRSRVEACDALRGARDKNARARDDAERDLTRARAVVEAARACRDRRSEETAAHDAYRARRASDQWLPLLDAWRSASARVTAADASLAESLAAYDAGKDGGE
jgi:hypothetical protein